MGEGHDGNVSVAGLNNTIINTNTSQYDDLVITGSNGNSGGTYSNQLADNYPDELAASGNAFSASAANGGVAAPGQAGTPEFNQILQEAAESGNPIKFTVNPNGDLVISPHTVGDVEINHSVLANGGYFIDGTNHSGHYQPSASSIGTAINVFNDVGIPGTIKLVE